MKSIDLSGVWRAKSADCVFQWTAQVPGSILQGLEELGAFGPKGAFYGENAAEAVRLMHRDFLLSREFEVDDFFLPGGDARCYLEAEGLDTICDLFLNGKAFAHTENMHRNYRVDITSALRAGTNTIEILFKDSLAHIEREHARRPLTSEDESEEMTVKGFYHIRKSHCSYGWDWGPKMPDAGIWRPLRIVRCEGALLESVRTVQSHTEAGVEITVEAEATIWGSGDFTFRCEIESPDGAVCGFDGPVEGKRAILIREPMLWWPRGMGDQPLYRLVGTLLLDGRVLQRKEYNIGLRVLAVKREKDAWGESFALAANGIPFFARGANYIPQDVYLNRVSTRNTERLVRDCVDANFNCLRVWGGGVYPDDGFFDLCDRSGIVVWQDLMFACAIYDIVNDGFLANISAEIEDNLRRIRHHACLGLVCGNNEMEWFFVDYKNFPHTKENDFEYLKQYHMVLPEIAARVCPEVFYWPASPSSGGYFDEPNSPDRGDCHYWAVWHGNKDVEDYKSHFFRFMSEFGFQGFPSMAAISSFCEGSDMDPCSPVMEYHQKRPGGNQKIMTYLLKHFRYPKDFDSLVYVSQLSQAEAIRHGVDHWRRNRGRCMGAIYWQLNDNWPGISWSSVDYSGNWKALHYAARRSFDDVLLSADHSGGQLQIHVSNETQGSVSGRLRINSAATDGAVLFSYAQEISVGKLDSSLICAFPVEQLSAGRPLRDFVVHACLDTDSGDKKITTFAFVPFKHLSLAPPSLEVSRTADARGVPCYSISCERPALFVEARARGADTPLSDNFFHLVPGEPYLVRPLNPAGDLAEMTVRSLYDSYLAHG